eukprot:scaffold14022_cov108-Isochrysis_galbana.AAC.6
MAWGVGLRVELDVGGIDAESLGHLGQQGAAWVAGGGKGSEGVRQWCSEGGEYSYGRVTTVVVVRLEGSDLPPSLRFEYNGPVGCVHRDRDSQSPCRCGGLAATS